MNDRYIPTPKMNDSNEVPRYYNFIKQLRGEERNLVDGLVRDLTTTGVLERKSNDSMHGVRDLHALVSNAAKSAISEDSFLPELYAKSVDNELGKDEDNAINDWKNPTLDGIGDLGEQYYPSADIMK